MEDAKPVTQPSYTGFTVQSCGLQVYVGHWPAQGPKVLLIHGLTANHRYWAYIAQALQHAGYDTYAMDLRGRGRSSKPLSGYDVETHAADAQAVLAHISENASMVIGHSLGATIALELAATHPLWVRKLVLMDGAGVISYTAAAKAIKAIKPALERLGKVYPDEEAYVAARKALVPPPMWTPEIEAAVRYEVEPTTGGVHCNIPLAVIEAEFLGQGGGTSTKQILGRWLKRPRYMWRRNKKRNHPPYASVRCPTLILKAGMHNLQPGDDILTEKALATMLAQIPQVTSAVVPYTNHYTIQLSQHPERDRLLLGFLAG